MKTTRLVPLALLAACAGPSASTSDPIQAALERTAARRGEVEEIYERVRDRCTVLPNGTIACSRLVAPDINGKVVRVEGQAIAIASDSLWPLKKGRNFLFELYRGTFYKGRAIALEVVEGQYICHVVDLKAGAVVSPGDKAATNL